MAHPLQQIIRELSGRLDSLSIPYMLMGGLAVRIWSISRATYDVDRTVSRKPNRLAEIFGPLEQNGYRGARGRGFKSRWPFCVANPGAPCIDIFPNSGGGIYQMEQPY